MKKFISISLILVGIALIATVVVWYLLQGLFVNKSTATSKTDNSITNFIKAKVTGNEISGDDLNPATKPPEELEIAGYTVTAEQKQVAESLGINLDVLSLTGAAIDCAQKKLSPERIEAILSGEAPTIIETVTLLPCLKK